MAWKKNAPGCPCCGSSGGHTIPNCPCTGMPDTLYVHVATPSSDGFARSVALNWQTTPTDFSTGVFGAEGYWSDSEYTSTNGLFKFRYTLLCATGIYNVVAEITADSPTGYGGAGQKIASYLVGSGGNTCGPPLSFPAAGNGFSRYAANGVSVDETGPP